VNSVPAAIAWEIYARRRPAILTAAASLPLFFLLVRYLFPYLSEDGRSFLVGFPFAVGLTTVAAAFNYAQDEGFPRRLYVRPARTWLLVACPMAYGAAAVVAFYLLWMVIVARWPVSFLVAMAIGTAMLCFQAIVWLLAKHRLLRIVALCALSVELVLLVCLPMVFGRSSDYPLEWIMSGCFLGQSVVAFAAALLHVFRDRVGASPLFGARSTKVAKATRARRARAPFRSFGRAMEWFEWRRGGWMLPVGTACGASAVLFVTYVSGRGKWTEEGTSNALVWLLILPMFIAALLSIAYGRPDAWSMDGRVPSIYSMRPITCGDVVAAKIRVALFSTLIAWAALILVTGVWLAIGADRGATKQIWSLLAMVWGDNGRVALLIATLAATTLATWGLMISSLWAGLSYRVVPITVLAVGAFVLLVGGIAIACLIADEPGRAYRLAVTCLPYFPWALATLVTVKMALAAWFIDAAKRRGIISTRFILARVAAWLTVAACGIAAALLFAPAVSWARYMLALVALLCFPLARVAMAPLSLADNRHR
jgi:hypothetical protein